jgi:steroid 5-alpha reductase family enzyme
MNLALIAWNAAGLLVYMTVIFVIAYKRKRLDTVDAAWGGAFVVAAWMVAGLEPSFRTILIAVLIDIWAIRLTNHILQRSAKSKTDDQRYVELASKWNQKYIWPRAYVSVFLVQGIIALIVSLPTVFAAGESLAWALPITTLGVLVWVGGFLVELIGDKQLKAFISNPKNKGKVLDKGLWQYTRHPNYLGEIMQWYGIGIIACASSWGWIGLIGPVILNVVIRYVSGVPPIERRKQKDPAYRAYMQKTHAILPKFS